MRQNFLARPSSVISGAHLSYSAWMKRPRSCGVPPRRTTPSCVALAANSLLATISFTVLFSLSTVAAGVNFPARTIVLFNSDYFNGHDCVPLDATGFHQMTGRAGRRGQDNIGFMLLVPGRFMDLEHVRRLVFTRSEDIESRIKNDFSMVLNLLLSQTMENVRHIFENSLAAYQQDEERREGRKSAASRLWRAFQRHVNFLKAEGFVGDNDRLTADGVWTSQLRLDHPVLIAECLRRGALPNEDAALLAAATSHASPEPR